MKTTSINQNDLDIIETKATQIIAISHLALGEHVGDLHTEDLTQVFRLFSEIGEDILVKVTGGE
ncbi:hypothetical protein F9L16_20015 [Agarivorans sp. B2Z047]|uniref:hypothetical protein n=1 Tax=Agarivorans sp. B2Z047 TaxID=2652721 RepID=UPI00128D0391|nr:hypothetical protein [Agarivorans sp. B2Z047]MPW31263.1 hypothetical protein [Agarivorans sp. B2Z047]UQN42771.1 hypothetical protein LQZ07_23850 [Agarivorans sp. B2Z047]